MPHVSLKLYPGRSEQEKIALTEQLVKAVMTLANCAERSVSVAIEEVSPAEWPERVYRPEILENPEKLYRKPGYNPFE